MKSAYELAMERLQQEEPDSKPLSEETKQKLAEIDEKFDAQVAEREIFLNQQLVTAQAKGEYEEIEAIRKQISSEKVRLDEEREAAKEPIRNA